MKSANDIIALPVILLIAGSLLFNACTGTGLHQESKSPESQKWKAEFNQKLPLLGHRNWILVVDKAFPLQKAAGMEYVYANEGLSDVLTEVLGQLNNAGHVKPVVYQDEELGFIKEEQARGIVKFRERLKNILSLYKPKAMLHDSVFKKLDSESKLFSVLVVKTEEKMPYTSVFLQLDCGYWDGGKEAQLRLNMK